MMRTTYNGGSALIMVLVFAGVFLVGVGALAQFVLVQSQNGRGKVAQEQALNIAEAGIEYYKWYLAHYPTSTWEGTRAYVDPATGESIGTYTIATDVHTQCGDIMYRDVEVRGELTTEPRFEKTVTARYMKPSVTNYSYIIDSNEWAGSTRTIVGPYYASGGIHMDAAHNSLVASRVSSWTCTGGYGCNPSQTKPGVWGSGSNPSLWQYPLTLASFSTMAPNFASLKSKAQTYGRFFESISNGAGNKGYRLVFKSNGTFDVYRVTVAGYIWGWDEYGSARRNYHQITTENFLGNYTVPASCGLIYVEDQVWLEGVVSGKVALVVGDTVNNYNPDVVLHNNLTYATDASVDGITVIAERDILFSAFSPMDLTVEGTFVALSGRVGRLHYVRNNGSYRDEVTNSFVSVTGVGAYQTRGTLTINGTVVSDGRTGTQWTYNIYKSGTGYINETSGFTTRVNAYERVHAFEPPPYAPNTTSTPMYVQWREGS